MLFVRNPRLDQDVRWSLLKLADLTFRAVEEAVPRLAIRLAVPAPAPTPDAPTKKVKLSLNLGGLGSSSGECGSLIPTWPFINASRSAVSGRFCGTPISTRFTQIITSGTRYTFHDHQACAQAAKIASGSSSSSSSCPHAEADEAGSFMGEKWSGLRREEGDRFIAETPSALRVSQMVYAACRSSPPQRTEVCMSRVRFAFAHTVSAILMSSNIRWTF